MRDALLAVPFGLAIGLLLGLVGAGGSILAVPVLVYVLGEPVKQATTESLLIVGLTALVGAYAASRGGRVRWRIGLAFAAAGAVGAVAGTSAEPARGGGGDPARPRRDAARRRIRHGPSGRAPGPAATPTRRCGRASPPRAP